MKYVEPNELPAKFEFIRIKLDELSQHGLHLQQVLSFLKYLELEKLHPEILRTQHGIAVEDLQRALGIAAP